MTLPRAPLSPTANPYPLNGSAFKAWQRGYQGLKLLKRLANNKSAFDQGVKSRLYDLSKIPHGLYCYDKKGICPYWAQLPGVAVQESGYCGYLKKGDLDFEYTGLLWDQVKECGIKKD